MEWYLQYGERVVQQNEREWYPQWVNDLWTNECIEYVTPTPNTRFAMWITKKALKLIKEKQQ